MQLKFDARRMRLLKKRPSKKGPVVYWMSREQRTVDNWALIHAAEAAEEGAVALHVVFCLVPDYMDAAWRQYAFMLKGLREVEKDLGERGIPFTLLTGKPWVALPPYLHEIGASYLVTDFDPVGIKVEWRKKVVGGIDIPAAEVDAHNIVPCWNVTSRKIVSFVNYRTKLMPLLFEFLTEYPELNAVDMKDRAVPVDWDAAMAGLRVDRSIGEVDWIVPGQEAALASLHEFIEHRLNDYPVASSNPLQDGQSNMSPYLHFGQISGQRVALEVNRSSADEKAKSLYLDRLIIQREIADNFCLHNPNYDTFGGFPEWARRSIDEHRLDPRDHIYTLEQFERAQTHDPIWNAAQMEMVKRGKMHGSLRAYWASKILEWSKSPEEAYETARYLNDRYQLDGRDASGYSGIANVIGGLYDRPWKSKDVIGKVKKLTYTEQLLRFDTHAYRDMVASLK
ncbi:MAG: Deoxyribodipyrimidine photo-lyase [Methanomassiliicoccales archaeon PtaU1.Bin124]|nr:MAG: Deoxyribodipyrimidine photo-lyase [Methanomassiliicoccales archaeon PtaU1.Bin124]